MAGHHQHGNNVEKPKRDHQDFEMEDLWRKFQQLQEHLEFYKNQGQGPRYHNSESKAVSDDEKENPLNRAHSHSSDESTPPHTRHIRKLQQGYDVKVDISKFEGNMSPDNFID